MIRYNVPCVVAAIVLSFAATDVQAQRRVPNYSRNLAISPYVNLFRGNTGGINSYFTFVRPIQNQARTNQLQQTQNALLQQQLLQQQFGQVPGNLLMQRGLLQGGANFMRGGRSQVPLATGGLPGAAGAAGPVMMQAPTFQSTAASYFNYSHYYGVPVSSSATFAR